MKQYAAFVSRPYSPSCISVREAPVRSILLHEPPDLKLSPHGSLSRAGCGRFVGTYIAYHEDSLQVVNARSRHQTKNPHIPQLGLITNVSTFPRRGSIIVAVGATHGY